MFFHVCMSVLMYIISVIMLLHATLYTPLGAALLQRERNRAGGCSSGNVRLPVRGGEAAQHFTSETHCCLSLNTGTFTCTCTYMELLYVAYQPDKHV